MLSQAKIALIAGILLGVVYVHSYGSDALTTFPSGAFSVAAYLVLKGLPSLALPVMLIAWYRLGVTITLTKALRWWTIGTAIVFCAMGPLFSLLVSAVAPASAPQTWPPLTVWRPLGSLSQWSLLLLLIALAWRSGDIAPRSTGRSTALKSFVFIAIIAAAVTVVQNTVQLAQSTRFLARVDHGQLLQPATQLQIALSFALNSLAPLCRLMIPLIVYKGLRPAPPGDPT